MKTAAEWKEIIEKKNLMGYTPYDDIYEQCKNAIRLALEIDRIENCKMEYVIILNEQGKVKTVVSEMHAHLKLEKNEVLITKINKYITSKNLLNIKDEEAFVIKFLKSNGLYDYVMQKMPNGFDMLEMLFEFDTLYIAIDNEFERYAKGVFIDNDLDDFTKRLIDKSLNRLYGIPNEDDVRNEVLEIIAGDMVDAPYYKEDNKIPKEFYGV